jgi:hypothetical protein
MSTELKLQVPDSLLFSLERQAREHGLTLEELCLSRLSGDKLERALVDPQYYETLSHDLLREELRKVIESDLTKEEVRKRINRIETQISRRYIR